MLVIGFVTAVAAVAIGIPLCSRLNESKLIVVGSSSIADISLSSFIKSVIIPFSKVELIGFT